MSQQPPTRKIMISSTALDLPEHRRHARDACERMSMLPLVMEQMSASPVDALARSRRFVDDADFYLGIFAFRYGFVPEGSDKSITELEYDHAAERRIPVFIFIAHEKHPVSFDDVETGSGAEKLEAFKERLKEGASRSHVPVRRGAAYRDHSCTRGAPSGRQDEAPLHCRHSRTASDVGGSPILPAR